MAYEALFTPIKIRGLELKNRIILPGMNTRMVKNKNHIADDLIQYHVARAKGGCGLNIMEIVTVSPESHAYVYMGLYNEKQRDELKKLTSAVHEAGGKCGVQIWHGGFVAQEFFDETCKMETPDTLTTERIHEIVKEFGRCAHLAVEAGFDVLEFHAAHTYLPHEFLNPTLNKRTDEYGNQSLENRARFILEVVREMRANMPEDMPLFMRFDAIDEQFKKNTTLEETAQVINWAADAGVDVVDLSRGNASTNATVYEVPPYNLAPGFNMENIAAVKRLVKIPVIGVGRLVTPDIAEKYLEEGYVDMVAIGRGQIADPQWCNKAKEGRADEIRHCIGCTQGCYDKFLDPATEHITCLVNPQMGLEYKGIPKTDKPKDIMIIGAGMGGMYAAEYLKLRGHNPTIYEASDKVGGNFILAAAAPKKEAFKEAAEYEKTRCRKLGIDIKFNTEVTPELIDEIKPEHVVIACGGMYKKPGIPGIDGADIYSFEDVLTGKVTPMGQVVVLGGGGVGMEVAEYLGEKGAKVMLMDGKKVGNGMGMLRRMFMNIDFPPLGIKRVSNAMVNEIQDHKILYKVTDWKTKKVSSKEKSFDALIICTGMASVPTDELKSECDKLNIPYDVIGDAKKVRMALDATQEAYELAMRL